mmetsp:Transcript_27360/g.45621  ORF Transcript_27360/g.45621 Transcript_27360/m.45621 type:complete len:252 (+) Transcript_27360:19-774(+)
MLLALVAITCKAWNAGDAATRFFPHGVRHAAWLMIAPDNTGEPKLREAILAQKYVGNSDRDIVQSDLLKDLVGASEDLLDDKSELQSAALPMPRAGEEPFGRWFQSEGFITLELFAEVESARDVRCEVGVGFLDVRVKDVPLLSGRLAQAVLSDVDWLLDDSHSEAPGTQLLCIELKKKQWTPAVDSGGGFGVALFESLKVRNGESSGMSAYFANGLVTGRYLSLTQGYRPGIQPESEDPGWSAENPFTLG